MSYAEHLCLKSIVKIFKNPGTIIKNYRPDFLKNPKTGKNLEIDLFIPKYKIGFEIQGQHHFEDLSQKERDKLKIELCKKEDITLFLISLQKIGPRSLYTVLKKALYPDRIKFLKFFDNEWLEFELECKKYADNLKEKYGDQDCFKSDPRKDHDRERKRLLNRQRFLVFLDSKPILRAEKENKIYDVIIENIDKTSVFVSDIHSNYKFYISINSLIKINNKKFSKFLNS